MKLIVGKSSLSGNVAIPGSKSHTVRAVALASLASGESIIHKPLVAADTLSAVAAYRALGADIEIFDDKWIVRGYGGKPEGPDTVIDVGNSGTTLYIALGSACLGSRRCVLTGDEQIQRRPAGPLVDTLYELGADIRCEGQNGTPPIIVNGAMKGGSVKLECSKTSQYLTSLLINCPLADGDTIVEVENLVEQPYVEMTLRWIAEQGIKVENHDFKRFVIPGGQSYMPFEKPIPADWSSAAFFMCAASITGSTIELLGLDLSDTQGDKAIADMLTKMGAIVEETSGGIRVTGRELTGSEFDLSDTPDALPAMSVTACFAKGETRLVNVAQARLKETDRISVMCSELRKMGADIEELPDGLIIRGSALKPAQVQGHKDHRVIMALAMAGLAMDGETIVEPADALDVTFPTFVELMLSIGADIRKA